MRYILAFSYIAVETSKTSNGTPFKQGDTLSIRGTKAFADGGWPSSIDGVYKVVDVISRPGLVVTGGATAGWGTQGSINMPMNNITVSSSGGAVINNAKTVPVGGGISTDWWLHAFTDSGSVQYPAAPPVSPPVSPPRSTPPPQAPRPVIDPGPPPRDNGNNLDTSTGPFNVGEFIARANFKLGTSAQANNRGAARFIADATKAAKTARLTESQTKKLLDAVRKAIADARAKVKNKPLPKPKGRR
jgi:hypothetical protein